MKKENKKMAQERRAAERKKQATMRLVRNTLIIALIVAFFVGMIVYGVIDSRKQKAAEAEDAQQQATDTSSQESTTQDSSDTTKETLLTDTSLEVKEGDTVNIDYSGSIDGYVFQGGTAEGQDLTIGSNTFIDDFEEQLEVIRWERLLRSMSHSRKIMDVLIQTIMARPRVSMGLRQSLPSRSTAFTDKQKNKGGKANEKHYIRKYRDHSAAERFWGTADPAYQC